VTPPALRTLAMMVLMTAAMCFAAGLILPIVELRRFFVFDDGYSILSLVATLWGAGEWLLAAIVAAFAILFPALKLLLLGAILARLPDVPDKSRMVDLIDIIGKWSMLDVLVVAVLIVAVKVSGIGTAATQPGLYLFVAAVMLSIAGNRLVRRVLPPVG
jgi:paraquat-inducible protein A